MSEFKVKPTSPYSSFDVLKVDVCHHCDEPIGLLHVGKGRPGLQAELKQWIHASGDGRCQRGRTYAEPKSEQPEREKPF